MRIKKSIVFAMILVLLSVPISLAAKAATQEKDIYIDTGEKIGRLIYMEQYYSINNGNLTLDQGRTYFDGNINSSRITFMIVRPLDKQGDQYSENRIRAIATLDDNIILNTWYGNSNIPSNSNQKQDVGNAPIIGLITIIVILLVITLIVKKVFKRTPKQ